MAQRLDLQAELEDLMGAGKMVKFQPPPNYKLTYPCCLYELSSGTTRFADNYPYTFKKRYSVTIIDRNPDTDYVEMMAMRFQMCTMDRAYSADGLNHYVFTLYY